MVRDYFAEEILGEESEQTRDYFAEEITKDLPVSKPKSTKPESGIQKAKPFLGSQTLGNIGMTIGASEAASRAATRANPFLNLAGPFAGLSALMSAESPQKTAASKAVYSPDDVPTFVEESQTAPVETTFPLTGSKLTSIPAVAEHMIKGIKRDIRATARDIYSSPFAMLLSAVPKMPVTKTKNLGALISKTKGGEKIGSFFTKQRRTPWKWAKDKFAGPKLAKAAKKETIAGIKQQTSKAEGIVSKEAAKKLKQQQIITKNTKQQATIEQKNLKIALDKAEKKVTGEISRTADAENIAIQEKLPRLFKEKSIEYGKRQDVLVQGKSVPVVGEKIKPILERNLIDDGILQVADDGTVKVASTPMLDEEIEMMNMYRNLVENPHASIDVIDIIRTKQAIRPNFGKVWTKGDHLRSSLSQDLSKLVEDVVPGIKTLNKEFAPYLRWKKEAIKVMKPFNTESISAGGRPLLKKVATDRASLATELTKKETDFLNNIDKYLKRDSTGKLRSLGARKAAITEQKGLSGIKASEKSFEISQQATAIKSKIDQELANKIREIRSMETKNIFEAEQFADELIAKLKKERTKAGVLVIGGMATAFPTFKKYIIHKLKYSLTGVLF